MGNDLQKSRTSEIKLKEKLLKKENEKVNTTPREVTFEKYLINKEGSFAKNRIESKK